MSRRKRNRRCAEITEEGNYKARRKQMKKEEWDTDGTSHQAGKV